MAEPLKAEPLVFPLAALPDTAQRGDRNRQERIRDNRDLTVRSPTVCVCEVAGSASRQGYRSLWRLSRRKRSNCRDVSTSVREVAPLVLLGARRGSGVTRELAKWWRNLRKKTLCYRITSATHSTEDGVEENTTDDDIPAIPIISNMLKRKSHLDTLTIATCNTLNFVHIVHLRIFRFSYANSCLSGK